MKNPNKRVGRKRLTPSKRFFRSSITNGSAVLREVDHRSAYMRRFRDLISGHATDLGGIDVLSEGQYAIIRRAALLQTQLELMEQKFAEREDGVATTSEIETYQRAA